MGSANALADGLTTLRLFLHVLGAAVWVGGQIVVGAMVPTARRLGNDAPRALARAFARLAWPAYALVVVTGFWNVAAVHASDSTTAWKVVLGVKIAVVALAGVAALVHGRVTAKAAVAAWGAVAALSSVAALLLGVLLAG